MTPDNNPFQDIERFFERMSHQFEDAASTWNTGEWTARFESMAVDLVEHDEEFVATVDLPGFEHDDVEIRVSNHTLRIEAEREEAHEEEAEGQYIRRERRHEAAERSLTLPADVDTENVDATMRNGVLTITLPKLEVEEARTIEIEES